MVKYNSLLEPLPSTQIISFIPLKLDMLTSQYNLVATFEEQQHQVDQEILSSIADLFIKHEAHYSFGICLLHRHIRLRSGHAMVHSKNTTGDDICRMEKYDRSRHHPLSFYWVSENQPLPFEFSDSPTPYPSDYFLSDLGALLFKNKVNNILALSQVSPNGPPYSERLNNDANGTVAVQMENEIDVSNPDVVITEWGFQLDADGIRVRPLRECKEPPAGGHEK